MLQLDSVVVGVDFEGRGGALTRGSRAAVDMALALAKPKGRIVLAHSSAHDVFWRPLVGRVGLVSEGLSEAGRQSLDRVVAEVSKQGFACEVAIDGEKPHLALLRVALRERAGLVVLGKHEADEGGLKLGNVARKVVHMSPMPALVVRPPAPERIERVLAATDLSPVGALAVEAAGALAQAKRSAFDVVHAFPFPLQDQFEPSDLMPGWHQERVKELAEEARAALRDTLARSPAGERAEVHVANGPADEVIHSAVERFRPDVLVLGTISRGGIAGLLVGNTAERLLERVPCSILAVKPADFVSPVTL